MGLRDYQENAVDAVLNHYRYRDGVHGYVTAPGGSGKSHLIAEVATRILELGAGRVVILARSEKLLTQNHSKFDPAYHDRIGMYCAGLGEWNATRPITIASVQSIASVVMEGVAVILVDECDEINSADEESQYMTFFTGCGSPVIIGFTATSFRTGTGRITWGEEIVNIPIAPLFTAGYLTPPTNKVGTTLDLSAVPVRIGEYVASAVEEIYSDPALLELSVRKIKQYSADRSSVLIYCQSLRHADVLVNAMEFNGMPATLVSGDTDKEELGFILEDFYEGRIKYLVNVALLIRGYDMPSVDMIALLLATKSKRKFEQILYRGTRLHPGKRDFLVLDMGNNFATHGPLGSPYTGDKGKERGAGAGRICPTCETFVVPPTARQCSDCGYEWPEAAPNVVSHSNRADSTSATIYTGQREQVVNTYEVTAVTYEEHQGKAGKPNTLKVTYYCGFGRYGNVSEWLSVSPGANQWGLQRAQQFFKERGNDLGSPINTYTMDDLLFHAESLRTPHSITVDHSEEFPRITKYHWEPQVDTSQLALEDLLGEAPL